MENMGMIKVLEMIDQNFWKGKKIFVTGNTGFKGSWLCLWLHFMGADITGYALDPPTNPNFYELCKVNELIHHISADIRNSECLANAIADRKPEIIFHLAAQSLVRESYKNPVDTYTTNVMGTVNLLEAVRYCPDVRVVVNVTTDKCYDNKEWIWGYRETDSLGGYDPYSSSKACSELVTIAYRNSFFNPQCYQSHRVGVATARAGNVIGGGDWAKDRLIPDIICALLNRETIIIRNPQAIRPWQHVLEPLSGYLLLAQKLYEDGDLYSDAWNFGPNESDAQPVKLIAEKICEKWQGESSFQVEENSEFHEATFLKLDCTKAKMKLGWFPRWDLETAIDKTIEWVQVYQQGNSLRNISLKQIQEYLDWE